MQVDSSSDKLNLSMQSNSNSCNTHPTKDNNEFTVVFLKDQLKFLTDKIKKATMELEDKERVIQKLEHEKRDI